MSFSNLKSESRGGFTLTEAAIVLGIVGLILAAIWSAAGSVYRSQRVSQTAQQLTQMVQNIRSMYASSARIEGGMTDEQLQSLKNTGVFPKDMLTQDKSQLVDLWGGKVEVKDPEDKPEGCADVDYTCFQVTLNNVPKDSCSELLVRMGGLGRDAGLNGIGVEGNPITANPVQPKDADTACASEKSNKPYFIYNIKG